MKQKILVVFTLLIIILFSGCKKKDDDNSGLVCTPVVYPGLNISIDGDVTSEIDPGSPEYAAYIACIQNCALTAPDDPDCIMDCLSLLDVVPAGGAFGLKVVVTNTTGSSITYIVEPGDWFEPSSGGYQPMMSPIHITQVVLPGETITMTIPVYCLASDKSAPDEDSEYSMCDIVNIECLSQIVDILETKDIESLSFAQSLEVQQIIWACTEGREVDWAYLNSLPDL